MTIYFNLVCWSCGKKRGVEASRHPEFAFEVAQMADALGMKGVLDMIIIGHLSFAMKPVQQCSARRMAHIGCAR